MYTLWKVRAQNTTNGDQGSKFDTLVSNKGDRLHEGVHWYRVHVVFARGRAKKRRVTNRPRRR